MSKIKFIHYLISIFISIYIYHSSLVNGQGSGGVDETTPIPTPPPTPQPTTEFPKTLSFSIQLLMKNAKFLVPYSKPNRKKAYTLDALFRRVLCVYMFGFPSSQCGDLDDTIDIVSPQPTKSPTLEPTLNPTFDPTIDPTHAPSSSPTEPSSNPTFYPTFEPTFDPTLDPTTNTDNPTISPTFDPTVDPTSDPTSDPTFNPTLNPTPDTNEPTYDPTIDPTNDPTLMPTESTNGPSTSPTSEPTTSKPTRTPTPEPTSAKPTSSPTTATTINPTSNPTFDPTIEPTFNPTSDPTLEPTMYPSMDPTGDPTMEPTWEPTGDPTIEPTMSPMSRRRLLSDQGLRRLLANTTSPTTMNPSTSPSLIPTISPITLSPSKAPTPFTIYDLTLNFKVEVKNKAQSDLVYNTIKSVYFFNEFKQALLDALQFDPFVLTNYDNSTFEDLRQQIQSMQPAPFNDIGILSPTHSPTMYPTYNYEQGESYGYWMIGLGICIIIAVIAYWAYTKYSKHQDYKEEQKSAAPNQELQTLFDVDSYKE